MTTDFSETLYTVINEEEIHEELFCPICREPFLHPVIIPCCLNTFCESCVSSLKNCPMCRERFHVAQVQQAPLLLRRMLSKVQVKCDVCKKQLARDNYPSHLQKECHIQCDCGSLVPRDEKEFHEKKCVAMSNMQERSLLNMNLQFHGLRFRARDGSIIKLDCSFGIVNGLFGIPPFSKMKTPKGIAYVCGVEKTSVPNLWFRLESEKVISLWNDIRNYDCMMRKGFETIRKGGDIKDVAEALSDCQNDLFRQIFPPRISAKKEVKYKSRNGTVIKLDCSEQSLRPFGVSLFSRIKTNKGVAYVCGVSKTQIPTLWFKLEHENGISLWDDITDYTSMIRKGFIVERQGGNIDDVKDAIYCD